MTKPERFDEPWQAQLFALTVAMSEAGQFTWADWTNTFSATLRDRGADRPLDGGTNYYMAWLAALEDLLDRKGLAPEAEADAARTAWERAYLSTPHGQPVRLPEG